MTRYRVRPMGLDDIDAVSEVERECFATPWPSSAYRRELRDNRMGRYIVLAEVLPDTDSVSLPAENHNDPGNGVRRAVDQLLRPFGRVAAPVTPPSERIVGFAGMWLMLDEAHITTIGVIPALRGHGYGELLFATLLEIAMNVGARRATLEVRVSNQPAQSLYRKYGFRDEGVRRRYQSETTRTR
ncbi:MAG TPA: ribosomal protein S18-alanine N-acetyltransferase [Chloroflexota bacterium]|nr:ribosomal protein S18-alanine N-acetyltransferase [Chloroflexota bacterium]